MRRSPPAGSHPPLPIEPFLDDIAGLLARDGRLLLAAETGAGKTTLVPRRLLGHPEFGRGKILLLEPRRLAARAAADRIAALLGEGLGRIVGLRTRLETRVSAATRLEVVTEGVLTRLLQNDPSLADYGTLLFDEFHTRSLQGDLGLALAWEARRIFRPDMRLALFSATLPAEAVARAYGAWPVLEVPGRTHPVEVIHRPPLSSREQPWEGAARLCLEALDAPGPASDGTVLCFLPGWREMARTRALLQQRRPELAKRIVTLHGRMPPERQREVLDPAGEQGTRLVLATNVAETSLTIPGVTAVADTGLERRVRFSPRTGMNHWETVKISRAAAEQRRGRAGRTGPGVCFRWWPREEVRADFAPPEILESDLAALVLETCLWGAATPLDLAWVTPPPAAAVARAEVLLQRLGLVSPAGKITDAGRGAAALGMHPRLARMVLDAGKQGQARTAAVIAALLENDDVLGGNDPDFRTRVEAVDLGGGEGERTGMVRRVREDARRILRALGETAEPSGSAADNAALGPLLLAAYPERAAQRTRQEDPDTARYRLASGRGAIVRGPLAREEFLVIADLDGGEQDARVFLAAPVTRGDLESGRAGPLVREWTLEWQGWKPRGAVEIRLGALCLRRRSGLPPAEELQQAALSRLRSGGLSSLPWSTAAKRLLARIRFAASAGTGARDWPDFSETALAAEAEAWLAPFGDWQGGPVWDAKRLWAGLEARLGRERRRRLDQLAPESLVLPSGSRRQLDYERAEVPVLSARVQEFFGCTGTPGVCGRPVLLELLSPAGRPVQMTRDLDGFWERGYPEVRKQLQGRYPRHAWPDDPRRARPTAKAKPRRP